MSRLSMASVAAIATLVVATTAEAGPHGHRHRPCASSERVLGRRTCGVFGDGTLATRLPSITLGLLAHARALEASAPVAGAGIAREQQPGARPGGLDALGSGVRLIAGLAPPLYAGFEGSIGLGVTPAGGGYGAFAAILGGRRRLEHTTLAMELAAGVISAGSGALEPRLDLDVRLRLDRWITPWVTVGAFAGVDPFERDRSFGGQLAIHLRAFDGDRP